jgi:hypothetical protein
VLFTPNPVRIGLLFLIGSYAADAAPCPAFQAPHQLHYRMATAARSHSSALQVYESLCFEYTFEEVAAHLLINPQPQVKQSFFSQATRAPLAARS